MYHSEQLTIITDHFW